MSFGEDINNFWVLDGHKNGDNRICFVCHEKIDGAVVCHDGAVDNHEILVMLVFHPKCAILMGQRLISDGFPNRRK